MTRSNFSMNDIHLAIDGELAADDRADFERWLNAHPDMKAQGTRFTQDRNLLAEALGPVLDEPVPARLLKLASGEVQPRRRWMSLLRNTAAAAVIFVAGGVAGYLAATTDFLGEGQVADQLAETAIDAYVVYAASKPHAVEVGADRPYLEGWLSNRVGLKLVVPDLTAEGFELLGGRILPAGQHAAALLVYQNKAGDQLSIYVTSDGAAKSRGVYTSDDGSLTAVYWLDKGYGCAIVGALPHEQLREVARNAWRQMADAVRS